MRAAAASVIVLAYYYNLDADSERFIGATIWDPGTAGEP